MISSYKMLLMYRYIYLLGAFLEPLWGLYMRYFNAEVNEFLWARFFCGFIALIAGLASFKKDLFYKYFREIILAVIISFVSQRYFLLYLNPQNWNYIMDLYTIVILSLITVPTIKDMFIFIPLCIAPSIYFPAHEYATTFHLITVTPLVGCLKWVFFDIVNKYEESKEKLEEQSVLLGAKNLVSSLTHSLNNNLEQINLSNQMLQLEKESEHNQTINNNINEIVYLFDNYKNIFHKKDHYKEINLNQSINKVIDLINIKNIKLHLNKDFKIKVHSHFEQAIQNILENASFEVTNEKISIEVRETNENILIYITDHANNLNPENNENIFKPFFTTKKINQGTGLGLTTAREIIRKSDGDVSVVSNNPTTFEIILPKENLCQE